MPVDATRPAPADVRPEAVSDDLAWRAINSVRVLAMDAVEQAQSGHPGTAMALAPAAYVLWTRFLRHNPADPAWVDRDRFVMSCGHVSMLVYSLLHLTGYDLPLEEIRSFRQWGSKTPGHPERGHTAGVETTTGPLGQGVGNAVGMAIAERFLAHRFNRPRHDIVDHRVWAFVSDGDLMEGVASEAASLAGHLALDRLTFIYDDNHITIDGVTELTFTEDVGARFVAYGWHVVKVADGNDLDAIDRAFQAARAETTRPTLVILRTVIADPAPTKRNTSAAHGAPLGAAEVARTKEILGWAPDSRFHVPEDALDHWRASGVRGGVVAAEWAVRFAQYRTAHPEDAAAFDQWMSGELPAGWDADLPVFTPANGALATRQASKSTLGAVVKKVPNLVGGSADLGESTGVQFGEGGTFGPDAVGRYFNWGVREHGMAACLNGIAAHGGLRPFGSTFLVFADYMRASIRLSALMGLPVIYIGTHDSIGVGEDGPTHQPIEHLASLRIIPGLTVLRPADATETVEAWKAVLNRRGPSVLVLTRQKLPIIDRSTAGPAAGVGRGGYVLIEPQGGPQAILIASGSEVSVAMEAASRLLDEGVPARVVSLPSWELFEEQPAEYRHHVLPPSVRARVSIEAAATFGWLRYVTEDGESIGIDHFGASAPGDRLFKEFGITAERAVEAVRRVLSRSKA